MTVLGGKNEELQQELDAVKKPLKDRARTRRQLDKVLQDATFAVQSMLAVNVSILIIQLTLIRYCLRVLSYFLVCVNMQNIL